MRWLQEFIGHGDRVGIRSRNLARHTWLVGDVVDAGPAEFASRIYLEHKEVRKYLGHVGNTLALRTICDIGAGYGRMSPVLLEYGERVVAFEREPELFKKGRLLNPSVEFRSVRTLYELPALMGEFDFALVFTVLQHMNDAEGRSVAAEITRVVDKSGFVLLCEDTDENYSYKDASDPDYYFTIGRHIDAYKAWMYPFTLTQVSPRIVEPTYARTRPGSFMLFAGPQAVIRGAEAPIVLHSTLTQPEPLAGATSPANVNSCSRASKLGTK
jgi:SAM-dependent methyltransferase